MDQRRTMKGLGMTAVTDRRQDRRRSARCRTVVWIVGVATAGLMFDGYDLVVHGAVVSIFRRSPAGIGQVTPAVAGVLASYAILLLGSAGRHGMSWTGAPPMVTLLPPAIFTMRESPAWLAARSGVGQDACDHRADRNARPRAFDRRRRWRTSARRVRGPFGRKHPLYSIRLARPVAA
jgi:hypothetical protein